MRHSNTPPPTPPPSPPQQYIPLLSINPTYGYGLVVLLCPLLVNHVKCPDHVNPPTEPPIEDMKLIAEEEMEPMTGQRTTR